MVVGVDERYTYVSAPDGHAQVVKIVKLSDAFMERRDGSPINK